MDKILRVLVCVLICLTQSIAFASSEEFEVEIAIKDHKFIPEVVEVPAGTRIKIIVHNQDDTVEEFESIDLKREKIIPGNSKVKIVLAPLKQGEYKFFGDFNQETAQGTIVSVEKSDK
jgi:plastocyanin